MFMLLFLYFPLVGQLDAVVVFCNSSSIEDVFVVVVFCNSWTTSDVFVAVVVIFCNG